APILDLIPATALTAETLAASRASSAAIFAAMTVPDYPNVTISNRTIPGPENAPDLNIRLYQPTEAAEPTAGLLWFHGGGYVSGSIDGEEVRARALAAELGCVLLSVEYRLAPETPFPGPLEDCYAALRWLHTNAEELGVDAARLAVGGGSAGGGLAAALALLARDRGEVPLAFQTLTAPMLDDRTVTRNPPHPYTGEFIWTHASNRFGWTALLGQEPGGAGVSPYAAAARAEDLANLPAAFIAVGALDLFLEEDIAYAQRLIRAGVPTELHVYPGVYHGFQMVPTAQVTQAAARDQLNALRRALQL
ncbi:MAG TPA: alpha/beta hydrolase, partial [Caldilineaceae bacterium]|nr:alpha/beta hydrolase [Caldilineaceae bacterium]